jgi:hypothetical protein
VVSFRPGLLYPRETSPTTDWIGGWAGHRAGLDDMEKRKFLILLVPVYRGTGYKIRKLHLEAYLLISIKLTLYIIYTY